MAGNVDSKLFVPLQPQPEFNEPWRKIDWNQRDVLKKKLEEFTPSNKDVKYIKILVAGEIGAGKSSFINSVNNVFQERITSIALVSSSAGQSKSFTTKLKSSHIKSGHKFLPYIFTDIMGLESEVLAGSLPEDIVSAVLGHVKDGYKFDQSEPLAHGDERFTSDPNLSDLVFCLVYVVAADKISFTNEKLIDKLKIIRSRISDRDIPQVIIMTKIDEACPVVKNNLRRVYHSKKIKEKMHTCSGLIGVPLCNIFPLKNYHEEIDTNPDVDVLILKALEQIVNIANDRLDSSSSCITALKTFKCNIFTSKNFIVLNCVLCLCVMLIVFTWQQLISN
nr:interferon-induced protein 44-like isoform X2 [Misgurnus anguillicaudatus]